MTKGRWQKKYGENNDKEGDEDSGNDNLEPVVHVMGVSAWPGHADTMVTILNWKVGLRWWRWWWWGGGLGGWGCQVVVFDTMTMRQGSAIMSEGQFTLTDDTRRAATRQQPPIWYRWIARDCDDHENDAGNDDGPQDDNDHNAISIVRRQWGQLTLTDYTRGSKSLLSYLTLPTTHLLPPNLRPSQSLLQRIIFTLAIKPLEAYGTKKALGWLPHLYSSLAQCPLSVH